MNNFIQLNVRLYWDLTSKVNNTTTECRKPLNFYVIDDTVRNCIMDNLKKIANNNWFSLSGTDYAYVGEFMERHNERNDAEDSVDIAAIALFYATMKTLNPNGFADAAIFNDFQLGVIEKEIDDRYEDTNVFFNLSKYLLTNDTSFIDKMENNTITLMDALFFISWETTVDVLDEEVKTRFHKILDNAVSTIEVLSEPTFPRFVEVLTTQKFDTKGLPAFSVFKKAIGTGIKTQKDTKFLNSIGFTPLNIKELEFVLKKNCSNVSSLKTSRAIVSMLITLAETNEKFNDEDIKILKNILGMGKLPNKLEGGEVETIKNVVSYYEIEEKIAETNYSTFVTLLTSYNMIVYPTINIITDTAFAEKLMSLPEKVEKNNGDEISNYKKMSVNCSILHTINREETNYNNLITNAKELGVEDFETIFTPTMHNYTSRAKLKAAVANGLINIVHYANNKELRDNNLLSDYFQNTNDVSKLLVLRNTDLEIDTFVNHYLMYRAESGEDISIVGTLEEQREYIDIILEKALIKDLAAFNNLFLNFIVYHSNEVKEIYSSEEVDFLYKKATSLLNNLVQTSSYSYYGRFDKSYISNLNEAYMSDEEKERIRKEKEAAEAARKAAEKERKYNDTLAWMRKEIAEYIDDSGEKSNPCIKMDAFKEVNRYSHYDDSTKARVDLFLEIIRETKKIHKSIIDWVFQYIGSLVKRNYISFEESVNLISSLNIIDEDENVEDNDKTAYA